MRRLATVLVVSIAIGLLCPLACAKTMQVTGYVYLGVIKADENLDPNEKGAVIKYWQVENLSHILTGESRCARNIRAGC